MDLIFVFLAVVATLPPALPMSMGPYKYLEIHNIEQCDGVEPVGLKFHMEPKMGQDDAVKFFGFWNTSDTIGTSEMEADFTVSRKGTGTWTNFYVKNEKDLCHGITKSAKESLEPLFRHSGFKTDCVCPIPAGSYYLNGYPAIIHSIKSFPNLPYGTFRGRGLLKNNGSDYGCVAVELTIWPADKRRVIPGR